ncbi:MAG: transposase, partial [Desulfobacterales bacterium]|nr:transposase [Desulfobacterales bacterium]
MITVKAEVILQSNCLSCEQFFNNPMYMLNYLDNEHLRQDVCRAENRIESYHQLKRAIANIAGGKFRGSS